MKNFHGRISFWLVPDKRYQPIYQSMINTLSNRFGTKPFLPHVTVFSAPFAKEDPYNHILKNMANCLKPITLAAGKINFSDTFTKTLFIELETSQPLQMLSEKLRESVSVKSNYLLEPHLSLLYCHIKKCVQKELVSELKVPNTEIIFNQLKAISTQTHIDSDQDVKDWHEIASVDFD